MGSKSYFFELQRQRLIIVLLIVLMALCFGARNQRALFSSAIVGPPMPSAFVAFVQPPAPLTFVRHHLTLLPRHSQSLGSNFARPPAAPAPLALPVQLDAPEDVAMLQFAPLPVVGAFGDLNPDLIILPSPNTPPPIELALNNVPLSAIPEPPSWFMLLLGFFAVGAAMRASREVTDEKSGIFGV